jgi:predicted transcriptional regulator
VKFITSPLRVALAYAAAGSLWIIVSDWLAGDLAGNGLLPVSVQTLKGLLFVAATAVLVYLVVLGGLARIRRVMEAQRRASDALQEGNRDYARQHDALTRLTRGLLQSPDEDSEMRKITETVADTLGEESRLVDHGHST